MTDWMNVKRIAAYIMRGKRFTRNEIKSGRLKAAQIGGKREYVSCPEWCDEYIKSMVVVVPMRRRA